MKGYKAFNSDLTCRGFQYEIGETYILEDYENFALCVIGFHFYPDIVSCYKDYIADDETRICEIEALGEIQNLNDSYENVTNEIKIIREITGPEKHCNLTEQDGYLNSGYCNSGNRNSGDCNAGCYNTGDHNSGSYNSGSYNSGNQNSGMGNSGNRNSGDDNTGDRNSGCNNSGCNNSGDYNSGNWNSGCFNTNDNPTIMMFNKPSNWTKEDWIKSMARSIISQLSWDGEEYKQDLWDKLDKKDKATVMSLPNFDAEIFEECTGIRVE